MEKRNTLSLARKSGRYTYNTVELANRTQNRDGSARQRDRLNLLHVNIVLTIALDASVVVLLSLPCNMIPRFQLKATS